MCLQNTIPPKTFFETQIRITDPQNVYEMLRDRPVLR